MSSLLQEQERSDAAGAPILGEEIEVDRPASKLRNHQALRASGRTAKALLRGMHEYFSGCMLLHMRSQNVARTFDTTISNITVEKGSLHLYQNYRTFNLISHR